MSKKGVVRLLAKSNPPGTRRQHRGLAEELHILTLELGQQRPQSEKRDEFFS